MNILSLIPVGGETIHNVKRNLLPIDGTPLLKFTVDYAKSCKEISRVIVATADADLTKAAKEYGAETFSLLTSMAQKGIPIKKVLAYVLKTLQEKEQYVPDLVVFLEATHPFREKSWIPDMIAILKENKLDHVFLAKPEKDNFWTYHKDGKLAFLGEENSIVRDEKKPIYREMAGLGTVMKPEVLFNDARTGKNVALIPVSGWQTLVDIRTAEDVALATQLLKQRDSTHL